jgi:hypothetical protein
VETRNLKCPNCGAPTELALGEVEALCQFCGSRVAHLPGEGELEVVRTREEVKARERLDVERLEQQRRLRELEGERWRQAAGKVAAAVLPALGRSAGRAAAEAVLARGGGCLGCGCSVALALLGLLGFALARRLGVFG